MNINFSELDDIIIFSVNDISENLEPQGLEKLKGDAVQQAIQEFQETYKNYKKDLNFNYGEFLTIVEENLDRLESPKTRSDYRTSVAHKLSELAYERISQKESNFSWIHKIFHKFRQWRKGHGFKTKGEWGLKLASEMNEVDKKIQKQLIFCKIEWIIKKSSLHFGDKIMKEINGLSEERFTKALNDVIFEMKEDVFFGNKDKLEFYKKLDDDKKEIFKRVLLSRSDWYEQAVEIIEGADDNEFESFIKNNGMVKCFQNNPSELIKRYKKRKSKTGWEKRFFTIMFEAVISDYLKQDGTDKYIKISDLLNDVNNPVKWSKISKDPKLLTKEEVEMVKGNISWL